MTFSILVCGAIALLWLYFDDQRRLRFEASVAEAAAMSPASTGRAITLDALPTLADAERDHADVHHAEIELVEDDLLLVEDLAEPTVPQAPLGTGRVPALPRGGPQLVCKPASLPRFSERFGVGRAKPSAGDSDTIPGAAYSI